MAALRKIAKQKHVELTGGEFSELLYGFAFSGEQGFSDEQAARKAWKAHRSELMDLVGSDWLDYGRRPSAWWRFDCSDSRHKQGVWHAPWGGTLELYETEYEALERLGELLPGEAEKTYTELKHRGYDWTDAAYERVTA